MDFAIEVFGIVALSAMVITYFLEDRVPGYVLGFATACAGAAAYAWLIGSWPFFVIEGLWCALAVSRWRRRRSQI